MKFVVQKGYSNEVDIRLHYETKDKLKKFFWYVVGVGSLLVYVVFGPNPKKTSK